MGLRLLRRLAIAAAILIALFAAGNLVVERFAEDRVGEAIAARFDLERTPDVNIRGFPILLSLIRGSLSGIDVTATGVGVEDLRVERLTVTLDGIEVRGGLLGGGALGVDVGSGSVDARVDEAEIERFVRDRGERVRVDLTEGQVRVRGTRRFLGARRRFDATGDVRLRGRTLRFVPRRVRVDGRRPSGPLAEAAEREATVEVRIPRLPGGFRADDVRARDGFLQLRAVLDGRSIDLG